MMLDDRPRARPRIRILRGPMPGEMTLAELGELWGFGRTRTWELVTQERVIPFRRDRYRIYVQRADAERYEHRIRRGRPQEEENHE